MKKKILSGIAVILISVLMPTVSGWARDDFQYWHEFSLRKIVTPQWAAMFRSEQWLRDDAQDLYLANVSAGPVWTPGRFAEAGFFYRYQYQEAATGDDLQENRYYPELTLKLPRKRFTLSARSRLEYRDRSVRDSWRYRQQFKLAVPLAAFRHKVTPFVSDEIFADTASDTLSQNRFSAGFSTPVLPHTEIRIFYLLKSDRQGGDWNESQVLGTGLDLLF